MSWRMAGPGRVVLAAAMALSCRGSAAGEAGVGEDAFRKIRSAQMGQSTAEFTAIANAAVASLGDPQLRKSIEKQLIELLGDKEATFDAKSFACRQLMVMGTAECVGAVAALLGDDALSHMALYALERLPCPEAGKALRDALARANGKPLLGIVNSLGERRDREAVGGIAKLLGQADAELAEAAARALGKIAGENAAAAVAAARKAAAGRLRVVLDDAWLRCADAFLAAGQPDRAKAIYEAMFAPGEPQNVRSAALRGLVAVGGGRGIALILSALGGDDAALRAMAISFIREVPGAEATRAFAAQLPKLAPAVQPLVLEALASRGDAAATPAVVAAAGSSDAAVRVAALEALGSLGDAAVVPLLARAAAGEAKGEADAARTSLVLLRGKDVEAAVLAELRRADPKGKVEMIKALSARRAEGAVPELLKAAQDDSEDVRREAFTAIGRLATEKAMPDLVALLVKGRDDAALKAAERAVVTVAREIKDEVARTGPLLAALPNATPAGKGAILRILGRFGGVKPLAAVRAALADADASVQDAAVRSLAEWPDAAPADDLLKLVREAKNETHRVLALRGYVRMLALPSDVPIAQVLERYDAAMKLATKIEDKRTILAGMAELRHPAVLNALEPFLANEALKAEAEAAASKVAEAMKAPARLTASHNSDKAGNATDGKPQTRWDTGAAMSGGEWFMIELPVEQVISKITLDTTGSAGDYPRGYEVYISRDGRAWGQPVTTGKGEKPITEIPLKPAFGRFIKIVQTGKTNGLFWSIHELKLETRPAE